MRKIFLLLFIIGNTAYSQTKSIAKELAATRTNAKIKIDADLNEAAWKTASLATNFIEWRPSFGRIENDNNKTEIYLLYDDNAFYIGGYCHESSVDSISKEFVGRDVVGVNDFVGVMFDTYNDKINGFGYYVTPLGEQFDAKYSSNGEDGSWNSVYESNAKIVKDGWIFEMKIPYSAIRFIEKSNQNWGINITRRRSKSGQQLMWNPVNPAIGGSFLAQFGLLTQINNIKPPVRLSFSPYMSINTGNSPSERNYKTTLNGGMDVKYGISQAFTLDMTLVPDFGQVQSDNLIQNLSPFEVKYNEYRSFFTEGTELFTKGNLFYSRRIGRITGKLLDDIYGNKNATENVINNPSETKLINATKISGRTSKGLGIGVLNAITDAQYATVYDTVKGTQRDIESSPLTNYNIFVLDQTLKNNSSISLINTSVIRSGKAYDANVTAALWDFYDKQNKWNFSGKVGMSNLYGKEAIGVNTTGYTYNISFSKPSGRFNFNVWQEMADTKYQQNDFGFFNNNNYFDNGVWIGYRWLQPKKWYNRMFYNFNATYSIRAKPWSYQKISFNTDINAQLKNLWTVGVSIYVNPKSNDFYEPRTNGYVFKRPHQWGIGYWINTNDAKKYSATINFFTAHRPKLKGFGYEMTLTNQYRFNKKLTIALSTYLDVTNNGKGFAGFDTSAKPLVGLRQRIVVENTGSIKYNFNNRMGITLRARHYWSSVHYENYKQLQEDGSEISPNDDYVARKTGASNFNIFNVDMTYNWQFALGSFITFNWKQFAEYDEPKRGYFDNLQKNLLAQQSNNFSVKVIYFLDYLNLKKRR